MPKTTLLVLLAALGEAGLLISPALAYHGPCYGPIPMEAIWPLVILVIAIVFFLMFLGKKRVKKRKKRKRILANISRRVSTQRRKGTRTRI